MGLTAWQSDDGIEELNHDHFHESMRFLEVVCSSHNGMVFLSVDRRFVSNP